MILLDALNPQTMEGHTLTNFQCNYKADLQCLNNSRLVFCKAKEKAEAAQAQISTKLKERDNCTMELQESELNAFDEELRDETSKQML